jgi:peptidoglycan hydrolase-like protein with peptidoglycan-binding domain
MSQENVEIARRWCRAHQRGAVASAIAATASEGSIDGESGSTDRPSRRYLQTVLKNGSSEWGTGPGAIDGDFGPKTRDSVEAFQKWGGVGVDGIVGEQTWDVSLHALSATLETQVGLQFVIG